MFSFCEVYNLFLSSESFSACFVPLCCSWDKNTPEKNMTMEAVGTTQDFKEFEI
jgi:hypothetical protein